MPETTSEHPLSTPAPDTFSIPREAQTKVLEGERRVVTVVFTDLTDSTPLLEKIGTEQWVEKMNRILHIQEMEINRFGGTVGQFRGDGMVAFFGATAAHEDDPERAVLAALSMLRAFHMHMKQQDWLEAHDLHMRVGVDTGDVIVAGGGERQQWEETAMGIAVSIASRLEDAAEPGSVLVSENTYHLVESQFEWKPLGAIQIKGVSAPVAVFRPLAHNAGLELSTQEQAFYDLIPRIGREDEFRTLIGSVEALYEGRGSIVALTGEKGNGKSFLVNEVRRYFAHRGALLAETQGEEQPASSSLTWVRGLCRSYSQSWPYSSWIDLFHDWLGIRQEGAKEEKRDSLRRRAEEMWGINFGEHYPYLASFLGLPLEDEFRGKVQYLDGESLRQRIFLAVRSWIETASQNGPVVLVFSDMHWVDDSSLALLRFCLSICDHETLLWLFVFRPEREASVWEFFRFLEVEYPHRLVNVNLPPLADVQSAELIDHLIGAGVLPPETYQLIIRNAGGNPYYIRELIRAFIASGVLERESDNGWHATRKVTTLDLPNSLQQLLLARFDRLSTQERLVLQISAVIGPVFWLNMVQYILDDPPTLKADLAALQRAQFIQESGRIPGLGMQYVFKSSLIRDTAYDSLLSIHRSSYHVKAAEFLETQVSTDDLVGYLGMLAYHYHGAGNIRRELFYTILAADKSRKIYANAEALQHYSRALTLLEQMQKDGSYKDQERSLLTQRFEVIKGRREVYIHLGQFDAARADTEALLPLARQMEDDPAWLIEALLAQADSYLGSRDESGPTGPMSVASFAVSTRDELVRGKQLAEEALDRARQSGNVQGEMRSLIYIASARNTLKEPGWLEVAEQALALARQLGDLRTEVNLLLGIGWAYGMDNLPRSREYLDAALSRSVTLNDKAIELQLLEAIGQQFEQDGNYYVQLTEYEQKRLQLSREIGNRVIEGKALMFCGQIQGLYLGDYEAGLALEQQALSAWENIAVRLFPMLRMAQIQTEQKQLDAALETIEKANPLGERVVDYIGQAGLGLVTVILYLALGDEQHLRSAVEITSNIRQMVYNNLVSRQYHMTAACKACAAHLGLAKLLPKKASEQDRQYHREQALESSQTALNLYRDFGFVQVVECTSEEILFNHSLALAANQRVSESSEFLTLAFDEMMRKYKMIPAGSPFRKMYLDNIQQHQDIWAAYSRQNPQRVSKLRRSMRARDDSIKDQ